jgi:hypothetical protein
MVCCRAAPIAISGDLAAMPAQRISQHGGLAKSATGCAYRHLRDYASADFPAARASKKNRRLLRALGSCGRRATRHAAF